MNGSKELADLLRTYRFEISRTIGNYAVRYDIDKKLSVLYDRNTYDSIIRLHDNGECELNIKCYNDQINNNGPMLLHVLIHLGVPDDRIAYITQIARDACDWIKFNISSPLTVPQTFNDLLEEL